MKTRVWVGFCDDKLHIYQCEEDGRCVAVYPSRRAAREKYEDVRPAFLVIEKQKRRRPVQSSESQ